MRLIKIFLLLMPLASSISYSATNSTPTPSNFSELLQWAEQQKNQNQNIDSSRLKSFRESHNEQKQLLKGAQNELAQAIKLSKELINNFDKNEKLITELENQLLEKSGELSELSGLSKQTSGDLQSVLKQSLSNIEYPERLKQIKEINRSKSNSKVVTIETLETIWLAYIEHLKASGEINKFNTDITETDGKQVNANIVRVGLFNTYSNGRFLNYNSDTERVGVLVRQPDSRYLSAISDFQNSEDGISTAIIDPTRGMLLGMLIDTPTIMERINQGGLVGYIIIGIGILGLLIIIYRLIVLTITSHKISQQLLDINKVNLNNPLGRILKIRKDNQERELEELQMHIDEAILKELPTLEFGTGIIKLLSGVAPLLGLLGTVVGMILTFQSISLFGTGDPKLMATGISQALVTTMLGLVVAVPLLFGHALVSTRSRKLIQILDQQSAGLMAEFDADLYEEAS